MADESVIEPSWTSKLAKSKWAYRIGCLVLKSILLCLLLEIPSSSLRHTRRDKTWEWNWKEIQTLLLIVSAATLAYYAVQGSNPGFITEEMVQTTIEDDTLLGEIDDIGLTTRDIEYRKKKIQAMEETLAKEEGVSDVNGLAEPVSATKMDYCTVCNLQPPLRSYHCSFCKRCVATFDHHCFCIGTCIGEKNHCRFWWFITLTSVEVYTCIGVVHSGFRSASGIQEWLHTNSLALVAALFFWCFAFTAYSLCGFHTFLMLTNSTTRELGKGPEKLAYLQGTRECDLPFSNGFFRNLGGFCCFRAAWWLRQWTPTQWKPVGIIERNSSNICDNLWENQYYSCC